MKGLRAKLSVTGGVVSIVGVLAFLISGYGYQLGWWGLGFAFNYLLFGGSILGIIGLLVSFSGFLPDGAAPRQVGFAIAGIVLGGAVLTTASYWYKEAQKYPPIHDITTDTENPPQFDAIAPMRADAPNQTEYGGEEVAKIQKEHYPDITTLQMDAAYTEAFDRALDAARSEPWDIVHSNPSTGIIEATHTLAWYGFKDDVVIRVDTAAADSTASIVDVRSVSRVGRGDLGVNAWRVRDYLKRIKGLKD